MAEGTISAVSAGPVSTKWCWISRGGDKLVAVVTSGAELGLVVGKRAVGFRGPVRWYGNRRRQLSIQRESQFSGRSQLVRRVNGEVSIRLPGGGVISAVYQRSGVRYWLRASWRRAHQGQQSSGRRCLEAAQPAGQPLCPLLRNRRSMKTTDLLVDTGI
jgi:hypothetical protein